ncbi:MAG TPA: DUF4384 domain-containing protein [Gemmatimonadales bacterium]|nr:DUF4384 domain-containing protein [Gemmatimonadales bacterium]
MYGQLALAVAALIAPTTGTPNPALSLLGRHLTTYDRPRVNIWLNQQDPYRTGEPARVFFKTNIDAFITVLRVDTDGKIRVLFPVEPWEDNYARGGRTFEVLGRSQDEAFRIDDPAGVGYVFAVTGPDPFNYDEITRGDHWDYRAISDGQVRGDPYVALTDLAARIAGPYDYDYDIAEYYVERHYEYPRFVCYDCHGYVSYNNWDPYDSFCSRFRIVVYDDPYYYPYRYYGGRVAVVHPYRPEPRYVFKDYNPSDDYITRVATRPRGKPSRPGDADRSSADVGGPGRVPAPIVPRPRDGSRPDAGDRDGLPTRDRSGVESPRRVSADDQPSLDDAPDQPRRRPPTPTPDQSRRAGEDVHPSRDAEPRRAAPAPSTAVEKPRTKEAKPRQEAPRAEPQKQSARDRDKDKDKDKDKDSARSKPTPPKSTGEPELRRRKPS